MHRYYNPDNIVRNEPWYDPEREVVKVCFGECCSQKHPELILEALLAHFKGKDMQIVAGPAAGACSNGNTVIINNKRWLYGMEPSNVIEAVESELARQRESGELFDLKKPRVHVCHGPSCNRNQSKQIYETLKKHLSKDDAQVGICGCTGFCKMSNNIAVNGRVLNFQTPQTARDAVNREIRRQESTDNSIGDSIDDILGL